jgi:hypothetical protein
MKAVEKNIIEDSGETLWKCVAELESENSKLKATIAESAEEYEVLQLGNASLLAERNDFRYRCEDLEDGLAKVRSDSTTSIASLEAKIKSAEAHVMDVAAAGEKCLSDFEAELVRDLAGLRKLYAHNVQGIGSLCSLMHEIDSSAADYICWLSMEVAGLPKMFASVNENFISTAVEGALMMAGEFVDLDALRDATAKNGADILLAGQDVWRAACAVPKKWWCYFSYDYVLAAIRTQLHEVSADT